MIQGIGGEDRALARAIADSEKRARDDRPTLLSSAREDRRNFYRISS